MSAFVRCAATELAHYGVPVWGVLVGTGEPDPADGAAPALAVAGHLVRMLIGAPPPASTGDVFLIAGTTVRRLMAPTVERELIRADRRLVAADLAEVLPGALGLPVPARPSPAPAVSDGMSGRVAIVTGGSGGIGRAVALELASQNVAVVVADLGCDADGQGRNAGPAEEVAAQIRLRGGQAVAVCADVSCPQECRNLVDQAVQTFGRVDALCHAAGVVRQALVFESTDEDWARVLDVHLDGARQLVDACLDPMRHQRYGRIVLFSSRSVAGSPGLGAYSAAKGAVLAYGRMLAGQVGGRGICVNVVLPSGRTRASMPQAPDARRRRVELLRARHHGISDPVAYRNSPRQDPENNAAMIAWLCGEPAGAVNGRIFSTGDWRVELYRASTVTAPVTLPSHAIADIRALWPDPAGQAR
jgi:NAD(P)-dependent dehydrogenase (short-subunit alcohol dehydrogenase family)